MSKNMRLYEPSIGLLRRLRCGLLLAATLTAVGLAAQGCRSSYEYRNRDNGYAVRIPTDLKIETNQPPLPNHGFTVRLTPTTLLWADASSTDALTLDAAVTEERDNRAEGCRETTHRPSHLGELLAVELV